MKALLIAYFLMALLFLVFKTKVFKSPSLFLFRSLFPNWKFFDQFGYLPRLQFRVQNEGDSWTDWKEFHEASRLKSWNLFLNPTNNLTLSEQSMVQQVVGDIQTLSARELESAGSYLLLKLIVRRTMQTRFQAANRFQFRIQAVDFSKSKDNSEMLLLSPEYSLEREG